MSGQYRVHLHATHVSDESRDVPRDALNMIYDSDPLVHTINETDKDYTVRLRYILIAVRGWFVTGRGAVVGHQVFDNDAFIVQAFIEPTFGRTVYKRSVPGPCCARECHVWVGR